MATIWEIINPSDKYTMVAESFEVAAVACCFLGNGQYGAEEVDGERRVPIFIYGDVDAWFHKQFGASFDECAERSQTEAAAALGTVIIGDAAGRDAYESGLALIDDPKKKKQWRDRWHDKRRSSMNDIGKRAQQLSKAMA